MTFTKQPPTTPGFYAWRMLPEIKTVPVTVAKIDGQLCASIPALIGKGEWCRLVPAEEVEKAYREGWMHRDKFNYKPCDIAFNAHSRAKRVMEGKE